MSGVAPDGSPVELYARLPSFGEPELVHAAIAPGAEILELGAGAGRMTHRLIGLGHPVTAVDVSAEMLARIRGAETIHADISGLDLGRTFGAVLLASQLINVDDDEERAAFIATCARHVAPDGLVLMQRYEPGWAADPTPTDSEHDGLRIRVVAPRREGERLRATVEYGLEGQHWTHGPFTSRILDDDELAGRLAVGGLHLDRWLDERRTWLAATLAEDLSAVYVEVPEAEPAVGALRRRWDSAGAAVPTHVTILFPFLHPDQIDAAVEAGLRSIAAGEAPFDVRFERVGHFPSVTWLAPEPAEPFARLTDAIAARWPSHPPYGGAFDEVIHHLTVADGASPDVLATAADEVAAHLPITQRVHEVVLAERRRGSWAERRRYPLGARRN